MYLIEAKMYKPVVETSKPYNKMVLLILIVIIALEKVELVHTQMANFTHDLRREVRLSKSSRY